VVACVQRGRVAQREWARSSFAQRRRLLRILSRCTLEHAEDICRVSARDSGKTTVDAAFGEVLVTLEKLSWICAEGERWLRPEGRSAGRMLFYKRARVEWHPRGVVGAIVPWNYPFHNVLNPVSAAVFAGNAIVVKVSEHAGWSARFYGRMLRECLAAAGAPADLVQLITGFGDAGAALTREVSLMTFVGSTKVGKLVMREAAKTLTPVVLELGGKDPFVLLPGTDVEAVVHTAARAGWGAGGQNCIGAERFFVHASLVDVFVERLASIASSMRQGPPLNADGNTGVDIGAMCLPGEAKRIQGLVDDARAHGATIVAGGASAVVDGSEGGQFFPPTLVLVPAPHASPAAARMRLLHEEVFGPLVTVIPFETEAELIALANGCPFALGSSVFGPSDSEVVRIGRQIDAGMLACNDFATCYMCQSLPMGGVRDSGFGKFAGIEGLRGLCVAKAVVEDALPFVRTQLPPPLRYPLSRSALPFVLGLMRFFYGYSLANKLSGLAALIKAAAAADAPSVQANLAPALPAVPRVLADFIAARRAGNVAASVACVTSDVILDSANERIEGVADLKLKVFSRAAPAPSKVLLELRPSVARVTVQSAARGRVRVTPYVREFEVKREVEGDCIRLRQELHLRQPIDDDGKPTADTPKVCKIVLQQL
jgi:acyl-CoA reductase-like NAD-dependent aldehyde dehydrogenase